VRRAGRRGLREPARPHLRPVVLRRTAGLNRPGQYIRQHTANLFSRNRKISPAGRTLRSRSPV
jgi:hypothetical protein